MASFSMAEEAFWWVGVEVRMADRGCRWEGGVVGMWLEGEEGAPERVLLR